MTDKCLSDWELFSLVEGDGSPAHEAHLQDCPRCLLRRNAQGLQMADIAAVLRSAPIPSRARSASAVAPRWLLPVAAALTAAFLVHSWVPTQRTRAASAPLLSEISGLLFTPDARLWVFDDDRGAFYVQAALRGEAPCELQHGMDVVGCY
jgi:hypothetical protein